MTDAAAPVVLEARDLRRTYKLGAAKIPVLEGLDLTLRKGESVSVVGASGSGKTTMIQVLGLLDRPEAGSVAVNGEEILNASASKRNRVRNRSFGFVFQFYHLVPELTALENVLLPARIGATGLGLLSGAARERARELIGQVGLSGRERHRPSQLSGGERQRVAIARALMNRPSILFCDEPTGNLDPRTSAGVQDLLFDVGAEERAILLVTHDEGFARRCDRMLRLMDGRLVPANGNDDASGGD